MKTPRTLPVIMAVAALSLSAAGCSSNTPSPSATTATTKAAPSWDACSIPDSALAHANLDPSTKDVGSPVPDSTTCSWKHKNISGKTEYDLSIIADNTMTIQQVRTKYGNRGFVDLVIGGRSGLQYFDNGETPPSSCNLAFPMSGGGVVALLLQGDQVSTGPTPCDQVRSTAEALLPALPTA